MQGFKPPRRPVGLVLRALTLLEALGQQLLGTSEALPLAEALLPVLRAALPGGYAQPMEPRKEPEVPRGVGGTPRRDDSRRSCTVWPQMKVGHPRTSSCEGALQLRRATVRDAQALQWRPVKVTAQGCQANKTSLFVRIQGVVWPCLAGTLWLMLVF